MNAWLTLLRLNSKSSPFHTLSSNNFYVQVVKLAVLVTFSTCKSTNKYYRDYKVFAINFYRWSTKGLTSLCAQLLRRWEHASGRHLVYQLLWSTWLSTLYTLVCLQLSCWWHHFPKRECAMVKCLWFCLQFKLSKLKWGVLCGKVSTKAGLRE